MPTKPLIRKFSTLVQEGRRFTIECSTKWYFAKLTWTKDNNSQVPPSWVTQQKPDYENGNIIVVSTLTIEDMKLKDGGTYTCHSTSRFDSFKRSSTSVKVNVKGINFFFFFYTLIYLKYNAFTEGGGWGGGGNIHKHLTYNKGINDQFLCHLFNLVHDIR